MHFIDKLLEEKPSESALDLAMSLIGTSVYEERKKSRLEVDIFSMTVDELADLIEKLQSDQACNIDGGKNYSATDIVDKLKQLK